MDSIEELQKEILNLKSQLKIAETERDVLKAKLDYVKECFSTLKKGMQNVIEATEMAEMGID